MATISLYPNGTDSNNFTLSTGSDAHTLVRDDYIGPVAGDSNYLSATASGKNCLLNLDDFTQAHSSIDGVQIVLRAGNGGRSQTYDIETKLLPAGIGTYYTESTGTETSNRFYKTHTFTNRTTTDGSTAWNDTLIDGLRIYVKLDAHSGGTFKFTQAYVIVTYTEPVATDNAIFFGTNF